MSLCDDELYGRLPVATASAGVVVFVVVQNFFNTFGLFGVSIFSPWFVEMRTKWKETFHSAITMKWQIKNNNSKKNTKKKQSNNKNKLQINKMKILKGSLFFLSPFFFQNQNKKEKQNWWRQYYFLLCVCNCVCLCVCISIHVVALIWNAQKQSKHFEQSILYIFFSFCFISLLLLSFFLFVSH